MSDVKFLVCEKCGNLVGVINASGAPVSCCGAPMKVLEAGVTDAAAEKHVPVVTVEGDTVKVNVGAAAHPMTEAHSILWVYLKTDKGGHRKNLAPGEEPQVCFALCGEKPLEVYAYCNLHGLWKVEV